MLMSCTHFSPFTMISPPGFYLLGGEWGGGRLPTKKEMKNTAPAAGHGVTLLMTDEGFGKQ